MLVVVDVEADGPAPGHRELYSMVSFGAVIVEPGLKKTFKGLVRPISSKWMPDALAISGATRAQHEAYPPPALVIPQFRQWITDELEKRGRERATMISDNIAFDWSFMNYYLWYFCQSTPFGHSGRRINDLYAGTQNNASATQGWKKFRKTRHTHDPLDDAMSMAEALLEMKTRGLRFDMIPEAA